MGVNLPADFVYPPGFIRVQTAEDMGDGITRLTFPGGFSFYIQSAPHEAELIYNETVVNQEYFQNGLSIEAARCVIDIGANIGIFTMAVKLKAPQAAVYAFEPIPDTFHVLERNVHLLGCADVHLFNAAVGSEDHVERSFTYFPNMPGNSTALPALKVEEKKLMAQIVGKKLADLFLQPETRTCQVRTLSSVIREQGITDVDFLKVDVEGGEISVLAGIDAVHWPIFNQVAVEAHGEQLRQQVSEILAQHGFEVSSEIGLASTMGDSMVYGKRRQAK